MKAQSCDVLHANQLIYTAQAAEYDKKNHVRNLSIRRYYRQLFQEHVFSGTGQLPLEKWRCLDVGCGTGFLEDIIAERVGFSLAIDATLALLALAKRKFRTQRVAFLQADALQLPFRRKTFDLVCSNAVLHHIPDYEEVLSGMVALLRPGGGLFIGYEPNAIPYRLFRPLLLLLSKIVPEHRRIDEIRRRSQQDLYPRLKGVNIHELSEYHIFYGKGIDPFALTKILDRMGIRGIHVHFTSLYQALLLCDAGIPLPVDAIPEWVYGLAGRMSLSFSLTGTKR